MVNVSDESIADPSSSFLLTGTSEFAAFGETLRTSSL
jgi:hypothetical protein